MLIDAPTPDSSASSPTDSMLTVLSQMIDQIQRILDKQYIIGINATHMNEGSKLTVMKLCIQFKVWEDAWAGRANDHGLAHDESSVDLKVIEANGCSSDSVEHVGEDSPEEALASRSREVGHGSSVVGTALDISDQIKNCIFVCSHWVLVAIAAMVDQFQGCGQHGSTVGLIVYSKVQYAMSHVTQCDLFANMRLDGALDQGSDRQGVSHLG
ncbi:hypothetical protein BC828DRAFT_401158 [Blastocladiella britannica]|nr:hypothetical protein BC828DRAFT_401158 [Blastocladiella britannica]